MAITCPRCGAGFDVTLFQFGHGVRCGCGAWVTLASANVAAEPVQEKERPAMTEQEIGKVTHYFGKIGVVAIELTGALQVGDTIRIHGHTSDFTEKVATMQVDGKAIERAGPGDSVGIKIAGHARPHDVVFKVTE